MSANIKLISLEMVIFVAAAALPTSEEQLNDEPVEEDFGPTNPMWIIMYIVAGFAAPLLLAGLCIGDWPKKRNGWMYAWSNWKQAKAEQAQRQVTRQHAEGNTEYHGADSRPAQPQPMYQGLAHRFSAWQRNTRQGQEYQEY
jgi:hypothetical protein